MGHDGHDGRDGYDGHDDHDGHYAMMGMMGMMVQNFRKGVQCVRVFNCLRDLGAPGGFRGVTGPVVPGEAFVAAKSLQSD